MKNVVTFALALGALVLGLSSIAVAQPGCPADQPLAVKYVVTWLSMTETWDGSYVHGWKDGRSIDQVCADLEDSSLVAWAARPGWDVVTLNLKDEVCRMGVKRAPDGRVSDNTWIQCRKRK